ncbi:hypothetical protein CROQUDRAFT_674625 [Cronartium quercuum f. sp. fusiforme G11]|uniref:Uncharacterized protein n=1 Tax=Cronartium quercuum f. sp. fusiforme G11 TaxID=708437 RepID=A0A9P6N741_9BASI|nr:hypothetical protein CROQUDRAFT_674625 [Cronartium quercuum f. sp. fusiforme G11]
MASSGFTSVCSVKFTPTYGPSPSAAVVYPNQLNSSSYGLRYTYAAGQAVRDSAESARAEVKLMPVYDHVESGRVPFR